MTESTDKTPSDRDTDKGVANKKGAVVKKKTAVRTKAATNNSATTEQTKTSSKNNAKKQKPIKQATEKMSKSSNTSASTTSIDSAPVVVKSGGKGLSLFAILLSLLALAGVGLTWYQTQVDGVRSESKLASGVIEIGGQVTRLGDSISRLQTEQASVVTQEQLTTKLLESSNSIDLQMRDLKGDQAELLNAVEKINIDLKKGVNEFVLDEVSQLLKLANNSAVFAGNAESAISALRLADIQLKELADPRFAEVRRKINEEIALLDSIETVDIERVSATLNAMSNKVVSLPLENEPPKGEKISVVQEPSKEQVNWRTELRRMGSDILNSVQIQRVDQPPKPLLAPQQRYFLNQNLQLNFAKAELALLQDKPVVYQQSLDSAAAWLKDYFDLKNRDVQAMLKQFDELKAEPLGAKLPSVAGSYSLLQTIKGGQ